MFIHSPIRLFIYLIHHLICPSVVSPFLPSFLPSFIPPPPILLITPLLTAQHTLAVSYVTYQLIGYFLLSFMYLIEDILYNIPHPSTYIFMESKASELLVPTPSHHSRSQHICRQNRVKGGSKQFPAQRS